MGPASVSESPNGLIPTRLHTANRSLSVASGQGMRHKAYTGGTIRMLAARHARDHGQGTPGDKRDRKSAIG